MKFNYVHELKKLGATKWNISRQINVSWNTVHMWDNGVYEPNEEHEHRLKTMFNLLRKGNNNG